MSSDEIKGDKFVAVLKVRRVGNSLGVTLPQEVIGKLNVSEGDNLYVVETPTGLEMSPLDPDFEASMQAYERTEKKFRNAFRELAK
jgi:putative addiction module antidote